MIAGRLAGTAERLGAVSERDVDEIERIREAATTTHGTAPHREIVTEGEPVVAPSIVLAGWACRARNFSDGRRQILSFLLPGDPIGMCAQREPLAATTITALTEVALCPAPPSDEGTGLAHAYAVSGALENSICSARSPARTAQRL